MSTKHTPGTWVVVNQPDKPANTRLFVAPSNDPKMPIAQTPWCSAEDHFNARLIAAAPDLLSALIAVAERYTGLVNSGDAGNWNPETESAIIAAREAISKATTTKRDEL